MKIHVRLHDGTEDDVDEAQLQKTEIAAEDADKVVASIEYCLKGCSDPIHAAGRLAQALRLAAIRAGRQPHLCDQHVHRSVRVTMKRWPAGMAGEMGKFA